MSSRSAEVLNLLNNSGLATKMTAVHTALISAASKALLRGMTGEEEEDDYKFNSTMAVLNSCGPAAAETAMEHALKVCKSQGKFQNCQFNGSITNNLELIRNDDGFDSFSNVARQFLLPRYAYLDFDRIVDPRHRVDEECGYPKFITPIMYRYMYDRDDMARRVNDIYADETWSVEPVVYEDEDEKVTTPFEEDWQMLCEKHSLMQYLYRMDKLAGIGHYGVLLFGINDGKDLEAPIDEKELLAGIRGSVGKTQREVLYLRPFDEYLSFIHQYETDVLHPRYGLPKFYNLVFLDMTIDAAGASIGTRLNRRVHWSRVLHVADNLQSSLVFGTPRQQPVFNRLLDLRKIKGGSAEMLWKGGFPGIAFEIDPQFVADDPEFDREEFKETIERYANGLQRYLDLVGIKAVTLNSNIADPSKHVLIQLQAIAIAKGTPLRILMGSEEGRLAANTDILNWNKRLKRNIRTFTEPQLLRNLISRFIALGIMRPPKAGPNKYKVEWPDLNTPTDEDRANLALKWSQAISQYVASGMIHLIGPEDYFTMIVGMRPDDALKLVSAPGFKEGLEKLKKVDPSKTSMQNGTAKNMVSKGQRSGTTGSRPKQRDSNQKRVEGSSS